MRFSVIVVAFVRNFGHVCAMKGFVCVCVCVWMEYSENPHCDAPCPHFIEVLVKYLINLCSKRGKGALWKLTSLVPGAALSRP